MIPSKIKLCIIHPNLRCGGSEKFISTICNKIDTNLFDLEVYIFDNEEPFYKITNPSVKLTGLQIKNIRRSLPAILKIVKKSRPDILFTASNHLNIFLCIFKFLFPKKLKLVARESSIVSINNKRSKYGKLYEMLVNRFYKNIDFIICQSRYMQDDLIKNYNIKKEKTTVIYNPVADFVNEGSLLPQHTFRYKFLTVGRLSPEKGIDRLLKALSLLTIDFSFYIIGDGDEKNNLKALAADLGLANKIFFEGSRSEPYENMSDANLFLIGSHYEGLPNAVIEAGALGIPVVGFNSPGGVSEIINDGVNGFLVNDDGNGIAFKDAIIKSLSYNFNKNQIREMTKNTFSVHRIMGQIENCFESIYKNSVM